jgi:hypothetical protein
VRPEDRRNPDRMMKNLLKGFNSCHEKIQAVFGEKAAFFLVESSFGWDWPI